VIKLLFLGYEPEESTQVYETAISSFQTSIKIEEALISSLQGDCTNLLLTADTLTEFYIICTTQSFQKCRVKPKFSKYLITYAKRIAV